MKKMEQSFTEGAALQALDKTFFQHQQTQFWVNLILFHWKAIKPWLSCFVFLCLFFLSRKRGRSQWRSALLGCPLTPATSAWTTEVTWSYFSSLLVLLQVCCWQMPPKRIRENPLLICWSIHKTGTAAKTSHSKDVSSSTDSVYITAVD